MTALTRAPHPLRDDLTRGDQAGTMTSASGIVTVTARETGITATAGTGKSIAAGGPRTTEAETGVGANGRTRGPTAIGGGTTDT